jgi:hypothetical protein
VFAPGTSEESSIGVIACKFNAPLDEAADAVDQRNLACPLSLGVLVHQATCGRNRLRLIADT